MEELKKVVRVIKKQMPDAPHETLLILDATTGQNAVSQTKIFSEAIPVSGLIMTKLDDTPKGGIQLLRDQKDVDVSCKSWLVVKCHCNPTYDAIANVVFLKLPDNCEELLAKIHVLPLPQITGIAQQ